MSRYALRRRGQQNTHMDPEVHKDSYQTTPTKSVNMDTITAQAKTGIGVNETRRLTHEFIMSQSSPETRLDAVVIALDFASAGTEALGAIVVEAWSMLSNKAVWEGGFQSAKEARERLDTPQLSAIRRLFGLGEQRKDRAINNIRRRWPNISERYDLLRLGEHHLEEIARTAEQYTYSDARTLLVRIRNQRLRRDCGGRSASRQITTGDWRKLRLLRSHEKEELLQESTLSADECRKYNIKDDEQLMIIHTVSSISKDTKNQRRRYRKSLRRKQQAKYNDDDATLDDGESSDTEAEMERETSDINCDNETSNEDRRSTDEDDGKSNGDKDGDRDSNSNNMDLDNTVEDVETDTDFVDIVHSEQKEEG